LSSPTVPRRWLQVDLGFDAINAILDEYMENLDPHYKRLTAIVKDPREESYRTAFPICLDSTKIRIPYSNDYEFQKSTFSRKLNGHFVTMTNVSLPDGTIIQHSSSSASVSPSHGDQRIIGKMLWRDEQAIERGDPPPTGMYHVMRGTDKYFMVIYADKGYTFQPRPMKADNKISE
jgi:hypothetical protein